MVFYFTLILFAEIKIIVDKKKWPSTGLKL